ncbi:MAG: hypothetical protein U5L11_05690 [Arhodomonas sp.]|nr:hypothetical protein [Arhodomonas sp.]
MQINNPGGVYAIMMQRSGSFVEPRRIGEPATPHGGAKRDNY